MTHQQHVAHASVKIHAVPEQVWDALTDPEMVRRYMEGANVTSSWTAGAPITWQGEYQGKKYEDHGKILRAERCRVLEFTHFSPSQGMPDQPENYHRVTIELDGRGTETNVTLTQEGNPTDQARQRSEETWGEMLNGLRQVVEQQVTDGDVGSGSRGMESGPDRGQRGLDAWSGPERGHEPGRGQMRGQERHRDRDPDVGRDPDRGRY